MGDGSETCNVHEAEKPHSKLVELSEILIGTWRVAGPDISGVAEYRSAKDGFLLVADVDFRAGGSRMKLIQHISYDEAGGTLRARYMVSMGEQATYTWALDGQQLRVSLENEDSDTYFQAKFNRDNTEYIGTWHYSDEGASDSTEVIVYTRVDGGL